MGIICTKIEMYDGIKNDVLCINILTNLCKIAKLKHLNYLNNYIYFHLVFVGLKFRVKQQYNKLKTLFIKKSKKAWTFTLKHFITELIYLTYKK